MHLGSSCGIQLAQWSGSGRRFAQRRPILLPCHTKRSPVAVPGQLATCVPTVEAPAARFRAGPWTTLSSTSTSPTPRCPQCSSPGAWQVPCPFAGCCGIAETCIARCHSVAGTHRAAVHASQASNQRWFCTAIHNAGSTREAGSSRGLTRHPWHPVVCRCRRA